MQAHGAQCELTFAEVAPGRIQRAQRGGGADIRTPKKIVGTPDVLRERFHGTVCFLPQLRTLRNKAATYFSSQTKDIAGNRL